jgi:hypothetical protein
MAAGAICMFGTNAKRDVPSGELIRVNEEYTTVFSAHQASVLLRDLSLRTMSFMSTLNHLLRSPVSGSKGGALTFFQCLDCTRAAWKIVSVASLLAVIGGKGGGVSPRRTRMTAIAESRIDAKL